MSETAWADWRARVKESIDLREVIAPHIKVTSKSREYIQGLCPFHGEKTGSFTVYADNFNCFGCEARGDIFDWLEAPEGGHMSKQDAMKAAAEMTNQSMPTTEAPRLIVGKQRSTSEAPASRVDLQALAQGAHNALMAGEDAIAKLGREYLEARGLWGIADRLGLGVITDHLIASLGPGARKFQGRLIIPYRLKGRVVSLTARTLTGHTKKYDRPEGAIPCPYNADVLAIAKDEGTVILTEGELDAASVVAALGEGFPVMGLPGGKLPDGWAEKLSGVVCYVLMDPDKAGKAHATKLVENLSGAGVKVRQVPWDFDGDLNEYLVAHGTDGLAEMLGARLEEAESPTDLRYIRTGFLEDIEARANRPHPAYTTGLPSWDALLGRGFAEGLHVLGGITAGGKTALSLQLAAHNAEEGRPVLYVSYEQSKFELWARVASRLTGIPVMAFKTGKYITAMGEYSTKDYLAQKHGDSLEKLAAIAKNLRIVEGDAGAVSADAARWTVPVIKGEAETLADAFGMPPLVVLDYLQRMPVPEKFERKELRERVAIVASSLQVELARGLGCPVLVLSSVGRAAYSAGRGGDDTPEAMLRSFKEAGEVEFTAYTGTILYRLPEEEASARDLLPSKFGAQWTTLALQVAKNREGETGRVFAKFYGAAGRLEDAGRDDDGKGK